MTAADVLVQYQQRIAELQSMAEALQTRQAMAVAAVALAALVAIGCAFLAYSRKTIPAWYPPLMVPPAVFSLRRSAKWGGQVKRARRLQYHYERGEARLTDRWAGHGCGGEEFQPVGHAYAADLHLFGEGSLFERLCAARTHLGRERLASFLTGPASAGEAVQRQAAVRELRGLVELREQIATLGKYDFEESKWRTFAEWLGAPATEAPGWLRPALLMSSGCLLALGVVALVAAGSWPMLWRPMLAVTLLHAAAGAGLLRRVRKTLSATMPVIGELGVVREGLALLAAQSFSSPKLMALTARVANAERAIARLDPWFYLLRERSKEWWYQLSLWLALGTQCALAIDSWKSEHREALLGWLEAWAEFEALNAMACYAYESPEDCWPEVASGEAFFEAADLGHPLLARESCVRNDVPLGEPVGCWVVSGSNMSGKSTLLRSIGLAAVLAFAGAPVRATRLRLAAMRVCASIAVADAPREGKSRFLAEVERLRGTLEMALTEPVLFLIDEIFSGTNSRDRQLAADAVVRTLLERRAIGAISTHDTALAAIAGHGGVNVHMGSASADPLDFDYRIKPGVTRESNGIAIARMAGVAV